MDKVVLRVNDYEMVLKYRATSPTQGKGISIELYLPGHTPTRLSGREAIDYLNTEGVTEFESAIDFNDFNVPLLVTRFLSLLKGEVF